MGRLGSRVRGDERRTQIKQSFKAEVRFYFEHTCYWSRELRLEFSFTMVVVRLDCCPRLMQECTCHHRGPGGRGGDWLRSILQTWAVREQPGFLACSPGPSLTCSYTVVRLPSWCPTGNEALSRRLDVGPYTNDFSHCCDKVYDKK